MLGTASAMPVRDRHFSAAALQHGTDLLLFDCGEGTQFQALRAGLKGSRLRAVFLTHLHGDHWFGLPGLLSTLSLLRHDRPLTVVGPAGLARVLGGLPGMGAGDLSFPLSVVEWPAGTPEKTVFEGEGFRVTAAGLRHGVPCAGYRFEAAPRPGRLDVARARALGVPDGPAMGRLKAGEAVTGAGGRRVGPGEVLGPPQPGPSFAYVTDTRPCDGGRRLAAGVDLLYHEATFAEDRRARAVETHHSTAREAAAVARDAGARHLLLGHFSARYPEPAPLLAEARSVFENTEAAEELKGYPIEPVPPAPDPYSAS